MKDRLADGLARIRDHVDGLLGRDIPNPGEGSALLPAGARRRRRIAEIGTAAGVAIVVLAFVGVTAALRPSTTSSPQPDGPGLPAPTEAVSTVSGSPSPPAPTSVVVPPSDQGGPVTTGRSGPAPSATLTGSASPTGPAPTTRAPASTPPRSTPPRTTPPATPTVAPTTPATPTPTPTETESTAPPGT